MRGDNFMHAAFRKLQGKMRQIFRQIAVWLTSVWAPKLCIPSTYYEQSKKYENKYLHFFNVYINQPLSAITAQQSTKNILPMKTWHRTPSKVGFHKGGFFSESVIRFF